MFPGFAHSFQYKIIMVHAHTVFPAHLPSKESSFLMVPLLLLGFYPLKSYCFANKDIVQDFSVWIGVDSGIPVDLMGCAVSEVVAAPGAAGAPGPEEGASVLGFSAPKTRSRPEAL